MVFNRFLSSALLIAGLGLFASAGMAQAFTGDEAQEPTVSDRAAPGSQPRKPHHERRPHNLERRLFENLDTNRDQQISREEFRRRTDERFDRLDRNRDGKLSREEVRAELEYNRRDRPPHAQ